MRKKTTAEWLAILEPYGMPVGPLNTVGQAVESDQIKARGMIVEPQHPRIGAVPMADSPLKHMSRTPAAAGGAAPAFAQDSADVFAELLGVDAVKLAELVAAGAVHTEGGPDIEAYLNG
jgi:crotonobetainyl-CoA:carnitine CoA-transferase CaiB-like acyl-CoA transferase